MSAGCALRCRLVLSVSVEIGGLGSCAKSDLHARFATIPRWLRCVKHRRADRGLDDEAQIPGSQPTEYILQIKQHGLQTCGGFHPLGVITSAFVMWQQLLWPALAAAV